MQPSTVIHLILLVFGFVCAAIAAFWTPQPDPRINFGWAALMFFIASFISW